jgi:serine/threonine-protein phosphatase 2A regulatory subunit B'
MVLAVKLSDFYLGITSPITLPILNSPDFNNVFLHRILQESLIALKTILKEIDPFAFEEALRMNANQKKQFAVKQDDDDRKNFDKKWERLNSKLKQGDNAYQEPECNYSHFLKIC